MISFLHTGLDDVTAGNDVISPLDASCRWRCPAAADQKNAIQNSSETRCSKITALLKAKSANFGKPWKTCSLLSQSHLNRQVRKDAEKCQRWSGQCSGHCQAVMMQIHLNKNHWVVKLNRDAGARKLFEKWTVLIMHSDASFLRHSADSDAFNNSLEFFFFCCSIRTTAQSEFHPGLCNVCLVNTAEPVLPAQPFPLLALKWASQSPLCLSNTLQTCRSRDRGKRFTILDLLVNSHMLLRFERICWVVPPPREVKLALKTFLLRFANHRRALFHCGLFPASSTCETSARLRPTEMSA